MTAQSETRPQAASVAGSLIFVLFCAFLVRGAVLFVSLGSFDQDPDAYQRLADNWRNYGVFGVRETPTAFRPPLYPFVLKELSALQADAPEGDFRVRESETSDKGGKKSFFKERLALSRNSSIALLHWLLGLGTVALVFLFACQCGFSGRLAFFAGLLAAVDPILLWQSRLVMTETLAAFFAVALLTSCAGCVNRRGRRGAVLSFLATGVLAGLAVLCRPAFLAFAGLVALFFFGIEFGSMLRKRRTSGEIEEARPSLGRPVLFLVGLALVLAPWCARNNRVFGRPILATTHGGYTLFLANNPDLYAFYSVSDPWSLWEPGAFHERRQQELAQAMVDAGVEHETPAAELFQDAWYRSRAEETMREEPNLFAYSCLMRFGELWRVMPNSVDSSDEEATPTRGRKYFGMTGAELKQNARLGIAVFYIAEFAAVLLSCLVLALRRARAAKNGVKKVPALESPWIWGFLLILSVQAPHLLYWTNMRMRAPLETFLPVLAFALFASCTKRNSPSEGEIAQIEDDPQMQ